MVMPIEAFLTSTTCPTIPYAYVAGYTTTGANTLPSGIESPWSAVAAHYAFPLGDLFSGRPPRSAHLRPIPPRDAGKPRVRPRHALSLPGIPPHARHRGLRPEARRDGRRRGAGRSPARSPSCTRARPASGKVRLITFQSEGTGCNAETEQAAAHGMKHAPASIHTGRPATLLPPG